MSGSNITKSDLVDAIYKSIDLEKEVIQTVVDNFLLQTRIQLEAGRTIELRNFGTFEARLRKGRASARNPKTGKPVSVRPHYVAAFRAGQILKEKLFNLPVKKDE